MTETTKSTTLLFADDFKIWRAISGEADCLYLQADPYELVTWFHSWYLEIIHGKSMLMHIRHGNSYLYTIDRTSLPNELEQKVAVIWLQNKCTLQCSSPQRFSSVMVVASSIQMLCQDVPDFVPDLCKITTKVLHPSNWSMFHWGC